jgi:hypothetical protein
MLWARSLKASVLLDQVEPKAAGAASIRPGDDVVLPKDLVPTD